MPQTGAGRRRAAGEPVLPRLQPVGDIGSDAKRQPAEKRKPGKSGNTDAARSNADTRREQQRADSGGDRDKARRGSVPRRQAITGPKAIAATSAPMIGLNVASK